MILWKANFKSINGASLLFSMNKNAMSDAIPMTRKIQNRLIVSALPPKKVMLSMNVLTDRIRVIIPGISITLP